MATRYAAALWSDNLPRRVDQILRLDVDDTWRGPVRARPTAATISLPGNLRRDSGLWLFAETVGDEHPTAIECRLSREPGGGAVAQGMLIANWLVGWATCVAG